MILFTSMLKYDKYSRNVTIIIEKGLLLYETKLPEVTFGFFLQEFKMNFIQTIEGYRCLGTICLYIHQFNRTISALNMSDYMVWFIRFF